MRHLLALSHSGVLEVNRGLYQALARVADVRVTLVVPERWRGDLITDLRFEPAPSDAGIRVVPLRTSFSGRGSLFRHRPARALASLAWEARPDVVLVDEEPWSRAASQAERAFRGATVCVTTKENLVRRYPFPFRAMERRLLRRTRLAFASSEEARTVLRSAKGFRGPIELLPFSYDPARFRPPSLAERAATRAELGLSPDRVVVAFFGRLVPEKGVDDLVALVGRLTHDAALDRVDVLVVGNGPSKPSLVAAATRVPRGRLRLLDAVPHVDVPRVLGAADVLVVPSRTTPRWKEQFGRLIPEALACGVPVVGSDSGEIPHLIRRTGGGLVVPERDADALVGAVAVLARDRDRAAGLATAGRLAVEAHLTHDAVARRLASDLRAHGLL